MGEQGPRRNSFGMPTVITHPAVALGLAPWFGKAIPERRWWLVGAVFSMVPDLDSIGFRLGIHYGDVLGHRGLTHSLAFAAVLALTAVPFARGQRWPLFLYLFLCTASHGVLDAFTDGGLGVAFLSPFSNQRFFFPWRPIVVSPIGITQFFTSRSLSVLRSELVWVVIPSAVRFLLGSLARGGRGRRGQLWRSASRSACS